MFNIIRVIIYLVIFMNKEYILNDNKYVLERDDSDLFDIDTVKDMVTDYFDDYDYIFGDMAYNKLRLKGFCDKNNKKFNKINDISGLDSYIKDYCAFNCKWFLLKKIK